MRLRVRMHHIAPTGRLSRVVVPDFRLRETHQTRLLWQHTGALTGSRADLLRLGALFRLAAISPHTAVYLPLRGNEKSSSVGYWDRSHGLVDLLLVRDDAQLRPSRWPAIRRGLKAGSATTVRTPPARDLGESTVDGEVRVTEHGETLVLCGSAKALFGWGDELSWCGNQVALNRDIRRYGGPALLSQFTGPGGAGRRDESWECMILAEDRFFNRRG